MEDKTIYGKINNIIIVDDIEIPKELIDKCFKLQRKGLIEKEQVVARITVKL